MTNGIRANDSRRILSHRCFDSDFPNDPALHNQYTRMEPGFMALSIYCAQMASKWSCVLDSRPRQLKDMSVEVYYDQFFTWKKKLEEVNYIGDEESYIDDFLFGLKMELAVGVWRYKWKPSTLYGAFRRAEIEELILYRKENCRKSDADEVFKEMSHPESVNSAELRRAEDISDENIDDVLNAPNFVAIKEGVLENEAVQMLENLIEPLQAGNFPLIKAEMKLVDQDKQTIPAGIVTDACQLLDEMTQPYPAGLKFPYSWHLTAGNEENDYPSTKIRGLDVHQLFDEGSVKHNDENVSHGNVVLPTSGLLKILSYEEAASEFQSVKLEELKNAEHMFDKMLQQLVKQKNEINGKEKWEGSMADFPGDLGFKADKMKVDSTNSLSKMMFGEMGVFMFDPGISSWLRMGCGFTKSNGVKHNFYKMPSNLNVELWVGKVIMFVFDPGLCAIFVNILEDKDVFEGVGKRMIPMDTILVIWDMKMSYYMDDFIVDYSLDSEIICNRIVSRSSSGKHFTPSSRVVLFLAWVVRTQNGNMVMALFGECFKHIYCDMNSFGGNSNVRGTRESGNGRLLYDGLRTHHTVIRMGWEVDKNAGFVCVTKVPGILIIPAHLVTHSFDASHINMSNVLTHLNFEKGAVHMISFGMGVMEEIGFCIFDVTLIVKMAVKVIVIAYAILVLDWCIKNGDELTTETIIVGAHGWSLKIEHRRSILQKVICNEYALSRWALYDYDGLKIPEYSIVAFCLDHLKHEKYQVVSIRYLAMRIDEDSDKYFEIKVGNALAIEIKYFWRCVSKVFQILLIGDDRVLVKLAINGFSCGINRVGLAAHITLKVDPCELEVPAFMKSEMHSVGAKIIFKKIVAWDIYASRQGICFHPFGILYQCNEIGTTAAARELKAIASREFYAKGKPIDPWRHLLDDGVLPTSFEDYIWDPGIVWVSHFTTLRTRWLLRERICHDMSF